MTGTPRRCAISITWREGQDAGRAGEGRDQVGDGRRPLSDGVFQLERLRAAGQADLDEDAAGDAVGLVVGEAVSALDDDLVAHPAGVGQADDLGRVVAGDAGGGLQDQPGAGARGDEGGLGAQHAGDGRPRRLVQLVDVHQGLRGLAHGLQRFRPQEGAAVARGRPRGVDDRTDAESLVDRGDGFHGHSLVYVEQIGAAVRHSASRKALGLSGQTLVLHHPDGRLERGERLVDDVVGVTGAHERPRPVEVHAVQDFGSATGSVELGSSGQRPRRRNSRCPRAWTCAKMVAISSSVGAGRA